MSHCLPLNRSANRRARRFSFGGEERINIENKFIIKL